MRFPRRAWSLAPLPALALACQRVDPEPDLTDVRQADGGSGVPPPDVDATGGGDAGVGDATVDGPILDASTADVVVALCSLPASLDAVVCDDFNRALLVPDGDTNWLSQPNCAGTDNPGYQFYEQSFNVRLPSGSVPDVCYLPSNPSGPAKDWVLTFDIDGSVDMTSAADASYLALSTLDCDGGQTLIVAQSSAGQPFLSPSGQDCHVRMEVYLPAPQNSTASSNCAAQTMESLPALHPNHLLGISDGGVGVLLFGYQDFGGAFPPRGYLDYDNVVLTTK